MTLKFNDKESWFDTVWDALHNYRELHLHEGHEQYDEEWNDIITAMAWIKESVGELNGTSFMYDFEV